MAKYQVNYKQSLSFLQEIMVNHKNKPWVVSFSGGKDSTLLLHLIVDFICKNGESPPIIYLLYNDTLAEIPVIETWAKRVIHDVTHFLKKIGVKAIPIITYPDATETYYWRTVIRGYPAPTFKFRWCVELLKISPTKRTITELVRKHGNVIIFTGVRDDESPYRANKIKRISYCESMACLVPFYLRTDFNGAKKIAPIRLWTEEDVWNFFYNVRHPPWSSQGNYYSYLMNLYLRGDFPVGDQIKPRFGCWMCTVAQCHRGLYASSFIDETAEILALARQIIKEIRNIKEFRFKKNYGYSKLGPLNEYGRGLMLALFKKLDELVGLYGLNTKITYDEENILLRELLFYKEASEVNKILRALDNSKNTRLCNFEQVRKLSDGITKDFPDSKVKIFQKIYDLIENLSNDNTIEYITYC